MGNIPIEINDISGEIDRSARNDENSITNREMIEGRVFVIVLVIVLTSLVMRVSNSTL
ncbi:hypothetical protein BJV38_003963 [Clostridium beijerinckii]|uniref:Uncharacterized protein n=1 Tax=Clostridium beijerinckii TaxID=1520 RepID=A0AAX0B209_CLOBE|nr:hypothetical protein [Clostridium beijerinckii]NRT33453.1 hypothetical protein [Clostridium beijerinckii]NRT47120.1 hypothetical protein [Clostridium beijerinckii]NRT89254.1 hypothetical protein [Clostridium beijerinckii]NRZ18876.1 hypothetical protein [Clostridium beijerinckii]